MAIPQILLCGLFVSREQRAGWLQAVSDVLPLSYVVEALGEVGANAEATATMWRDLGGRGRGRRGRPGSGSRHAAATDAVTPGAPRARRTGRRPGKQDTRESILAAARDAFSEGGYDGTSIRQIASVAGVDAALVHHYFDTKEQLFLDVVQTPLDPGVLLPTVFEGGLDGAPERIVRTLLSVWEGPVSGPAMQSLLRRGVAHQVAGRLLREFFTTQVLRQLRHQLGDQVDPDGLPLRAGLVASQLLGLGVARYILELEPLASRPSEVVVAAVAATVRRYLFEALPPPA